MIGWPGAALFGGLGCRPGALDEHFVSGDTQSALARPVAHPLDGTHLRTRGDYGRHYGTCPQRFRSFLSRPFGRTSSNDRPRCRGLQPRPSTTCSVPRLRGQPRSWRRALHDDGASGPSAFPPGSLPGVDRRNRLCRWRAQEPAKAPTRANLLSGRTASTINPVFAGRRDWSACWVTCT